MNLILIVLILLILLGGGGGYYYGGPAVGGGLGGLLLLVLIDRKSTRLNSSHRCISYAVFFLEKNGDEVAVAAAERHLGAVRRRGRTLRRIFRIGQVISFGGCYFLSYQERMRLCAPPPRPRLGPG